MFKKPQVPPVRFPKARLIEALRTAEKCYRNPKMTLKSNPQTITRSLRYDQATQHTLPRTASIQHILAPSTSYALTKQQERSNGGASRDNLLHNVKTESNEN